MKFPKKLRYKGKGKVLVTIYRHPGFFRLYWRQTVDGKRKSMWKDCVRYANAKRQADELVTNLAKSKVPALSPGQAADALNALEELDRFFQATGKRVSIRFAVGEYCEAARKLGGRSPAEAVDGYLSNAGVVKPVGLSEAVELFLTQQQRRTLAPEGKRPDLDPASHRNRAIRLRRFAAMFPNTRVCDLTKEFVDKFISELGRMKSKTGDGRVVASAKTRNHYRSDTRDFLRWAAGEDYLPPKHRLLEAKSLKPEKSDGGEIEFYSPDEFRALLEASEGAMRALIAIGGLAGLRTAELLRLDWADVWRVKGHVEVTAGKSKTRQRRLVQVVPALAEWLRPFRHLTSGPLWELNEGKFQKRFGRLCERAKVNGNPVPRKINGLRHAFVSYHFAKHSDENLTAAQAGNSPAMLHANYKGLATKAEGRRWFNVKPKQSATVIQFPAARSGDTQ